ncbi:MAG: SDR family oxidoreductase [Dehalococcoidia bacterium]|nr:SDR family oxidoreductase [Dehalococcoidia bacterium]
MMNASSVLLTDKVAVVTGGGSGIGKATCKTFAACGATVVIAEIDEAACKQTAREIEEAGGKAIAHTCDVTKAEEVGKLEQAVLRHLGKVDILMNNVGHHLGGRRPFEESTEALWQQLYDINYKSMMLCTRAFAPHMMKRAKGGSIINVSTVESFRAIPEQAPYSGFNAAIDAFTRSYAVEVGKHGIRVNAIAPDKINSAQTRYYERIPKEKLAHVGVWVPLGRLGDGDDIAGVALFLASDLSRWVTGTTIHADGGTLAAGGWYPRPTGSGWTNSPILSDAG